MLKVSNDKGKNDRMRRSSAALMSTSATEQTTVLLSASASFGAGVQLVGREDETAL